MEDSELRKERAKHLFLSHLQARVGSSLVSRLGKLSPEAVLETPYPELVGPPGNHEKAVRAFDDLRRGFDARKIEDQLEARGISVLTFADDGYPGMLRNIPDPPPALYVDGAVPDVACVALVGSRKASATGIEMAWRLGGALAERGVCVVSGLARGVDSAAHEGAVDAGGLTVGVLGCGIDVTYPKKYKQLWVALPRKGLRGPHAPIRTYEGLGTLKAPKGASQGAQTATSRACWRFWGKIQPAGYSYTALRHASIQRHSEAHGMGPMARGCCVILAR